MMSKPHDRRADPMRSTSGVLHLVVIVFVVLAIFELGVPAVMPRGVVAALPDGLAGARLPIRAGSWHRSRERFHRLVLGNDLAEVKKNMHVASSTVDTDDASPSSSLSSRRHDECADDDRVVAYLEEAGATAAASPIPALAALYAQSVTVVARLHHHVSASAEAAAPSTGTSVDAARLLRDVDVVAAIGAWCPTVSVRHFGSGTIAFTAAPEALRECLQRPVPASAENTPMRALKVRALLGRLCHLHMGAMIDPAVFDALERGQRLAHIVATVHDPATLRASAARPHTFLSQAVQQEGKGATLTSAMTIGESLVATSGYRLATAGWHALQSSDDSSSASRREGPVLRGHHPTEQIEADGDGGVDDDHERHFICIDDDQKDQVNKNTNISSLCDVGALLRWISRHLPGTGAVEARSPIQFENKFSRGILQSGTQYVEPFSAAGLVGTGVVIGVSDTGIDYDHCFFHDPNVQVPFNERNDQHRKIVRYQGAVSSRGDFLEGHGTHVAGSIAGMPYDPARSTITDFHGVLPAAKLSVWDMSAGAGEGLAIVSNFNDLFGIAYGDGARIHSNSWGSGAGAYLGLSRGVDDYVFRNPAFLPLFAAGNDADARCPSAEQDLYCDRRTVINPCVSKNALCVGASMGSYDSWKYAKLGNYFMTVPLWDATRQIKLVKGNFGPASVAAITEARLAPASPANGCSTQDYPNVRGNVAVLKRGDCFFTKKIQNVQAAGAIGAIVVNSEHGDAIIMGCQEGVIDCGVHIPSFMVDIESGTALLSFLQQQSASSQTVVARFNATDAQDPHKGPDNLSEFSSHGPTSDGRIKPDVVAVGELVISAFSDNNVNTHNCDVWATQGTSMATPLTAGNAGLVREYFTRGFHVRGVEDPSASLAPSAALLKATIIHAAAPLTGVFDRNSRGDWRQLSRAPTSEQGFGIVRLNQTLPIGPASPIRITVSDSHTVATGEFVDVCVRFSEGEARMGPFRATLVWTEPAADTSAHYTLINNLDLEVITPAGTGTYHGNMDPVRSASTDPRTAGAGEPRDVINNVEKVTIVGAPSGVYRVRVRGVNAPSGKVAFALVASGTRLDECVAVCAAGDSFCLRGTCAVAGDRCECPAGWTGPRCDTPRPLVPVSAPATVALQPDQAVYFTIPPTLAAMTVTVTSLVADGEIDFFVCDHEASGATNVGCAVQETTCDTCGRTGPRPVPVVHTATVAASAQSRVLTVVARCCYPAQALVQASLASAAIRPWEVAAIGNWTVSSATAGGTRADLALRTPSAPAEGGSAPYSQPPTHVELRSASLFSPQEATTGTVHRCVLEAQPLPTSAVASPTPYSVSCPTFRCGDGEYFHVTVLDAQGTVLAAPHASVAHARCSWAALSLTQPPTPTPTTATHEVPPTAAPTTAAPSQSANATAPSGSISVDGIVVREGLIAHNVIATLAEWQRSYEFVGTGLSPATVAFKLTFFQLSTRGDSGLVVTATGTFADVAAGPSPAPGRVALQPPPSLQSAVNTCFVVGNECDMVKVVINVVTTTGGGLIGGCKLFVTMPPRIDAIAIVDDTRQGRDGLALDTTTAWLPLEDVVASSDLSRLRPDENINAFMDRATRYLLLRGRMLGDPRTSNVYASLLRGASLLSAVAVPMIHLGLPLLNGGREAIYLNSVTSEAAEGLYGTFFLNSWRLDEWSRDPAVSLSVAWGGAWGTDAKEVQTVRIRLQGIPVVTAVSMVVDRARTVTVTGTAFPTSQGLLDARMGRTGVAGVPLVVVHHFPTKIVLQLQEDALPAGQYAFSLNMTRLLPMTTATIAYRGPQSSALFTGLIDATTATTHHLVLDRTPPLAITLQIDRLSLLEASEVRVVLASTDPASTEPPLPCVVVYAVGAVSCIVHPDARGLLAVRAVIGSALVPIPQNTTVTLQLPSLPAAPQYQGAVRADGPFVVGAPTRLFFATNAPSPARATLILSATSCIRPTPLGRTTTVLAGTALDYFEVVPTGTPSAQGAYLCLSETDPRSDETNLRFDRELQRGIAVFRIEGLAARAGSTPSASGRSLRLDLSIGGVSTATNAFVFADIIMANESCEVAARANPSYSRRIQPPAIGSGESTGFASIDNVVFSSARLLSGLAPKVCLALGVDDDLAGGGATLSSLYFFPVHTALDCISGGAAFASTACASPSHCGPLASCVCPRWRGGPRCEFACDWNEDTLTACGPGTCAASGCLCNATASVDASGALSYFRGPACETKARPLPLLTAATMAALGPVSLPTTTPAGTPRRVVWSVTPLATSTRWSTIALLLEVSVPAKAAVEEAVAVAVRVHCTDRHLAHPTGAAWFARLTHLPEPLGTTTTSGGSSDGSVSTFGTILAVPLSGCPPNAASSDEREVYIVLEAGQSVSGLRIAAAAVSTSTADGALENPFAPHGREVVVAGTFESASAAVINACVGIVGAVAGFTAAYAWLGAKGALLPFSHIGHLCCAILCCCWRRGGARRHVDDSASIEY